MWKQNSYLCPLFNFKVVVYTSYQIESMPTSRKKHIRSNYKLVADYSVKSITIHDDLPTSVVDVFQVVVLPFLRRPI